MKTNQSELSIFVTSLKSKNKLLKKQDFFKKTIKTLLSKHAFARNDKYK